MRFRTDCGFTATDMVHVSLGGTKTADPAACRSRADAGGAATNRRDMYTDLVVAAVLLLAGLPSLVPSPPGAADRYRTLRVLLALGPAAIATLAG